MRKLTYATVALIALVVTSYAVADGIEGAKSAKSVAGHVQRDCGQDFDPDVHDDRRQDDRRHRR